MRFEAHFKTLQEWKELVLPKIPDLIYVVCNKELYLIQRRDGQDNTVVFDDKNIFLLDMALEREDVTVLKSNFENKNNVIFINDVNKPRVAEALMVYHRQ